MKEWRRRLHVITTAERPTFTLQPRRELRFGPKRRMRLPENVRAVRDQEADPGTRSVELLPPHIFYASLDPHWLADEGSSSSSGSSITRTNTSDSVISASGLFERCLTAAPVSSYDAYLAVHDYHHATVHRRDLISLSVEPQTDVVGRNAPENLQSLRELFEGFGYPGQQGSPIYVFMAPSACDLDALLALLAAASAFPGRLFLLRPATDAEELKGLSEACRSRGNRPLSFCLTSLLVSLPAAIILNSKVFLCNGENIRSATPRQFETSLRKVLKSSWRTASHASHNDDYPVAESGSRVAALWRSWLKEQELQQLVRCEQGVTRLDGSMSVPALSLSEMFVARARENHIQVELWTEDDEQMPL